jgi:hypothetical protein
MLDGSDISFKQAREGGDLHMTRVKDQGGRTELPPRISKRGRSNFVSGHRCHGISPAKSYVKTWSYSPLIHISTDVQ